MPTSTATDKTPRRKRRGKGGCCGCLIVLIAVLVGLLWLARKWAPNHLNRGLQWSRGQVITRYPVLDRWLPQAPGTPPPSVFEPPVAAPQTPSPSLPVATPTPAVASPEPSPSPAPTATLGNAVPTEVLVGNGAEAKVGQTVQLRYGAGRPADAPEVFMIGASEVDPALEAGVKGMKVGGKRKLGELEVELVKVL